MSLSLAVVLAGQAATAMPWIPPLRSRAMVEVVLPPRRAAGALDTLVRACGERRMALVERTQTQVVCASEPDAASRLAYMSARPRPSGPLEGFVRFSLQRSGESVRLQGVRYAEFRTIGEHQRVVSDDVGLLREMLERVQPSQK